MSRPTSVRFTNEEGNILEEHDIPITPHHIQGSKVCKKNLILFETFQSLEIYLRD